ncbi:MAG: DNA primase [Candidatus Portnoybacteria bacterium]|nr:DNA primase [Candidatus Portnoybacteria bacterium]
MTPIEEIKNRLDIVDVIQGYVKLKKAGKDYKAHCPFHKEKNPSFYVSPSKQIWHCFSCNEGGDIFSFVQKIEGVEFSDALRTLAKKAGVELKREDPAVRSERKIIYDICEEAVVFFGKELRKSEKVKDYLKNRGLKGETVRDFRVGYAPDGWRGLYDYLVELGFKAGDMEKAGLVVPNEKSKSGHYDRFRNRIMFPVFDLSGQVVGFSGRLFDGEGAKYINTPDTLAYNKSHVIYALDRAKVAIRKKDECVLVEGQFDVVMSHQAGVKNAVAVSGSAVTSGHLNILKRYTDNLVFAFDADSGGEGAVKKAVGLAQELDFNIKVALLPEGKDPADMVKDGVGKWKKVLKESKPVMDFYFESVFSKYSNDLSAKDKRDIAKELLPAIKSIANSIEQSHWLQLLGSRLKVSEKDLRDVLGKIKDREKNVEEKTVDVGGKRSREEGLIEVLISLALRFPKDCSLDGIDDSFFKSSDLKGIFLKLKNSLGNGFDLKEFKKNLSSGEKDVVDRLIFKMEYSGLDEKDALEEIDNCTRELKILKIKKKMNDIGLDLKEAERKGNKKKCSELSSKFNKLTNELNKILNN